MTEAVLVMDMAKDTYDRASKRYQGDKVRVIVPPVQKLLRWARSTCRPVIFICSARRPTDKFWYSHFPQYKPDQNMWGTHGAQPIEDLYQKGDIVIYKRRLSGFYQSDLDITLKELNINRVIIVGSSTHVAVMLTAIEAFQRGVEVVIPKDCTTVAPGLNGGNYEWALKYMETWAKAMITLSSDLTEN